MRKWLSPVALGAAAGAASLAAAASLALGYITIDLPGASATTQELVTEKGQRAQLRLADGTKVVIGPGSRLEMPAQFAMSTRTVRLSGEAYFDVTPDDQRPFVVHAGGLVTEVLGTEFNVRAYPTELRVEVVVAEGQVTVQPDGSDTATLLERGELGEVVFGETPRIATKHVDLDRQLGWLDGQLVFEDTPIREVCAELERWYGVQVQVSDSILAAQQLTASFRDQPLSEVLEVIAATLDITYSQRGRMILFLPRDSNSPNLL